MILVLGMGISTDGVRKILDSKHMNYVCLEPAGVNNLDYEYIIKSPGISDSHPLIIKANEKGIEVITDIEFAYREYKRNFIGITGTNGKTTTSLLTGEILKEITCGNIGYSIGNALVEHDRYNYICELSSFQLTGIKEFTPFIACFLNISQAHIDYHLSMEDYIEAKLSMAKNVKEGYVIYNLDDDILQERLKSHQANRITFSLYNKLAMCHIRNKKIYYQNKKIIKIKKILLKGEHNLYNILASICISKVFDVRNKTIVNVLKEYKGINYRGQKIKKKVYNDAKSTNPASTLAAIKMFNKCNLICGGYPRKENFSVLDEELFRIKKVYCYGEGKENIKEYMQKRHIKVETFDTLEFAVKKAKRDKIRIPLLYSPMMASWDQYKSYVERGQEFEKYFLK